MEWFILTTNKKDMWGWYRWYWSCKSKRWTCTIDCICTYNYARLYMYMLYHIYISTVFVSGELLLSKIPRSDQVPHIFPGFPVFYLWLGVYQKRSTSAAAKIGTLWYIIQKTHWKDPPFSSWVNPRHFDWAIFYVANCNKLPEATTHQGFIIRKSRAFLWKKN